MKKELKVIAVVLAGIIVFLAGFGLGTSKGIQIDIKVDGANTANSAVATTAAPAPTAAPATTAAPAPTEAPATTAAPAPDNNAETKAADNGGNSTPSAIPSTPKEIAAKYNEVVNALKKQENVTVHKTGSVTMECTDCSVSFLTSKVTDLLKNFMSDTDETITFEGGKGNNSKGEERWINDYITPSGREATVTETDLASATAAAEGSGYKMTLNFKSEQATFDGTTGTEPTSHKTAMDPLNLATLELPAGAKITKADMTYPGATIEATVDGSGNLVKLHLNLPLEGSGTGKLVAELSLSIKGQLDDVYEITY